MVDARNDQGGRGEVNTNANFTHMQPHYYHVQQVEPCHRLG